MLAHVAPVLGLHVVFGVAAASVEATRCRAGRTARHRSGDTSKLDVAGANDETSAQDPEVRDATPRDARFLVHRLLHPVPVLDPAVLAPANGFALHSEERRRIGFLDPALRAATSGLDVPLGDKPF